MLPIEFYWVFTLSDASVISHELNLSFAADLPAWQQKVVSLIENGLGKRRLLEIYRGLIDRNTGPETFWDDLLESLELKISSYRRGMEAIPKTGPLVIVANHPFGLMDGASICWIVSQTRKDFKVVLWDVFRQNNHGQGYFLSLDLTENDKGARRQNLIARREAIDNLKDGQVVIIFPSGGAERPTSLLGPPYETAWFRFTEKMVTASGAPVLPIFVHGHNSRLFHMASHVSEIARRAMFIHEIKRGIGSEVELTIGDMIAPQTIKNWARDDVMENLRAATFALSDPAEQGEKQILKP